MWQPLDDERQKLFNEIAKLLVENLTLREYIKSISHDDKSFDPAILIELKILAQRMDLLNGLANTAGETLLEKAANYLSKSRILQDVEDSKLKDFLQTLSSLL